MTEVLNKIKAEYPSFGFHDGGINAHLPEIKVNRAKCISCENVDYYMTIHHDLSAFSTMPQFIVIATSLNSNLHYIKEFSSVYGLRLYLGSVIEIGI